MKLSDARVLILAPAGRDGAVASGILQAVGIRSRVCANLDALISSLEETACAVLTEEALLTSNRRPLADWVRRQPPWSDFPFILLTSRGLTPDERLPEVLGNVTVLERPFHPAVLVSAVRSALRARARQREVEAHLQERQRAHDRQSLLIRELHHRVKNTLATVQGLLGASARSTRSVEEFYHSFSSRIVSMANTHNLLTEDYWQTASLHEILKAELAPYDNQHAERLVIDGPTVELSADLAVPTGMAIHELTTNAAKYGALSVPQGKVAVTWDLTQVDRQRNLHLTWIERDGPPVERPLRKGFGSTLLERVLTLQCNATIEFDFEPSGLQFRMDAPLAEDRLVPKY